MMTRRDRCFVCDKPFDQCQYPISHSHPTIDSIKLPHRASRILGRLDRERKPYPSGLTLQERDTLQATRIHHNDFSTELEVPIYG